MSFKELNNVTKLINDYEVKVKLTRSSSITFFVTFVTKVNITRISISSSQSFIFKS